MFTGIIEGQGEVKEVGSSGTNKVFWIESPISSSLRVDESIAHDGVCLTIEEIKGNWHQVTAIEETLKKSNLNDWHPGYFINLERSLLPLKRLDGHFVQGHVDTPATCKKIIDKNGSYIYEFKFPSKFKDLVIEKGSIALNGISLTIFDVKKKSFSVSIIPYTYQYTNLKNLSAGSRVNIEFDLIGKYVVRKLKMKN